MKIRKKDRQLKRSRSFFQPSTFSLQPSGFSLLELVVVVFLISITAALVFPSFSMLGKRRVASDAKKIASLLRYLNDTAIYTKETYSLKFDLNDDSLRWKGPDGEKREKIESLAGVYLSSKGEIGKGQVTVFFGPLGAAEGIRVRLKDRNGGMTVTFNPISGRATITDKDEG
jgi:general secretion pathway protein H